ncbi:hypothetical protein A2130_00525 [Candidatus Woesebacteria bacterium GWC2_33_12]|uniref:Uncharacterized protein n=1 Tax=Candidatus Woesebacteria bacterium GW2011_GWB1_33_22 TaxID=1618566 RepID=A0A0G0BYL4_9BACT|nr:MAG: hypothetical protein UR29_C0008G0050 [Candidatus Woesebacteria bacterium GW2011_GWC2_33_12]KKP41552.1 MAG: hypothetical protein UR33_C0013G0030 [Candidatus Woesebacteria bacterium GW2011_GWA2_33_20]KKP44005.1 MAG: hypothetical protein UR35_C0013G0030 [Candidatus Woesebacteria bacterium GW2011_GWB1_33_22]KKP46554.1 MAG: hypothetical protein UR37_C0006G0004 [Microgenomates group bacterium GW2011_GWC1_33_28]KKP49483.1 MAG: hypothetical protein UR41_C0014G0030 [Candidatus Woesebacteria bact
MNNKLVGNAKITDGFVYIIAEKGTTVTLIRGLNKFLLLKSTDQRQSVKGKVLYGDVYVLENGENKLTVKDERTIYVNKDPIYDATSEKRKTTFTVGVLILVILVVSVIFGISQKNKKEFNKISEEKLSNAITNYELLTRESFTEAKKTAEELKEDGYKNEKLDELLKNIYENESDILGEIKVDLKEFLDLSLQTSGFNGESITSSGEEMFILDREIKSVIQVDLSTKKAKIVAGKDKLDGVMLIASYEDKLFSLTDGGIYQINNEKTKVKDKDWDDSLIYIYSANIYLIDKTANQVFRFSGSPQGKNLSFSDKQEWLAPGIEMDFSKVKDVVIDGSIWLLSSSGKVTKLTNGNPTAITMKGIIDEITNPTAIYTNEELKNVYILDKDNGRVVVLEKNLPAGRQGGNFKMQYKSDAIKEAKDLVVSEKENKVVLLIGSKLMYFEP